MAGSLARITCTFGYLSWHFVNRLKNDWPMYSLPCRQPTMVIRGWGCWFKICIKEIGLDQQLGLKGIRAWRAKPLNKKTRPQNANNLRAKDELPRGATLVAFIAKASHRLGLRYRLSHGYGGVRMFTDANIFLIKWSIAAQPLKCLRDRYQGI